MFRHLPPKELLSDRGANFGAQLLEEICKVLKIRRLYTSAYHPSFNGIVECFNKTLIHIVAHYVNTDQRNWDEWINFALFAYNTAVHSSTSESPFFLIHGRDPNCIFDIDPAPERPTYDIDVNYKSELLARLYNAYDTVKQFSRRETEKQKRYHDKQHKGYTFHLEDRVYLQES